MDPYWPLIVVLSILASAFSSGMEIAFVTANKLKVELDKKQGVFGSGIISHFVKNPKMFIATMLVGNNIALVIYGLYAGDALIFYIDQWFPSFATWLGEYGMLFTQTLISTIFVLVFGEFIPKAIFSINPNRWLKVFAIPMVIWYVVLWTFAWIIAGISDLILRLFLKQKVNTEEVSFGRIDLDHYVGQATGNIDPSKNIDHEIQIFQNALDFSKVKARDCLIPRNELVAVEITDTIDLLKQRFIETRLSKILVYRENIDHIIGYVHSFEMFKKPENIQHVLRPVAIIPEPMPANEILELFIKQKKNVAVVVDEYGGTAGIITMEDIVEEIFGEIEDEHDKEEATELIISEKEFHFSARFEIDYLNSKYNLNLPQNDEEYDTLGGLFLHLHEDIPEEGLSIEYEGYNLKALQVSDSRIELISVTISGK